MKALVVAAALLASPAVAHAASLADVVRDTLAPQLPADLGIAGVVAPGKLADLDVAPGAVTVELPSELHAGRRSVKVVIRGRHAQTAWILVSLARPVDVAIAERPLALGAIVGVGDVRLERRAVDGAPPAPAGLVVGATVSHDLALGAVVGAHDVVLPPPLPRGTPVTVDVVRGAVHVRGAGTLARAARPGDRTVVRLAFQATVVQLDGTLVAPSTVVVGGPP
jgi:flagella basal body P-ring formation protein FlgA